MRGGTVCARRPGTGRGAPGLIVGAWCLLMILGCAGPTPAIRTANVPAQSDGERRHVAVPFFPDDTDQCGPAVLASVLTYWGFKTDPVALKEEIYLPKVKGTLPLDLLLAAQARGLRADIYQGSLNNIKAELDAGHPVVALLDLGYPIFPQGHFVVITGYDDARRGVYVHSGLARDLLLPYERFLQSWEKTGRWTLLVVPSEERMRAHV
ncbi:MAG: peptidase C39 family protein [Nitrospirae bacterium]|nr:MAG: peptidase C39 family protein [Nitrospirota bacterium]